MDPEFAVPGLMPVRAVVYEGQYAVVPLPDLYLDEPPVNGVGGTNPVRLPRQAVVGDRVFKAVTMHPIKWVELTDGYADSAPIFTEQPSISGIFVEAQVLVADPGSALYATTFGGEWFKNDVATGVIETLYNDTLDGDEVYWRSVATNEKGTVVAVTATVVIGVYSDAPYFTSIPKVTGNKVPGGTLHRTLGTAEGDPDPELTGFWIKDGVSTGESGPTYNNTLAGDKVYWRTTATNAYGKATAGSNNVSIEVTGDTMPEFLIQPTIVGPEFPDGVLTRSEGAATGQPVPLLTGSWIKNNIDTLVTSQHYSDTDVGDVLLWRSVASSDVGSVSADSNIITIVAATDAPYFTALPEVFGTQVAGGVLTRVQGAAEGDPDPELSGEWFKNSYATGVFDDTYSDTVPGDVVYWRDTATNTQGIATAGSNYIHISA